MGEESLVPQGGGWAAVVLACLKDRVSLKAVGRLVATVTRSIGLALKPGNTVRQAEADAKALVAIATGKAKAARINAKAGEDVLDITEAAAQAREDRAEARMRRLAADRQENIERISAMAVGHLPRHDADVSDEPVDPDWVTEFFNHCQDVSREEMQRLWAMLLAGEVAQPGSFSLRTLGVLKLMGAKDATLFARLCSLVWGHSEGLTPIVHGLEGPTPEARFGLTYEHFVHLDSLGLARVESSDMIGIKLSAGEQLHVLTYHGRGYRLSRPGRPDLNVGWVGLTEAGVQLAAIATGPPDETYRDGVIAEYRADGWTVEEGPAPG